MRRLATLALLIAAVGCGGGHETTAREAQAEQLVESRAGEDVSCRDAHAVNTDLYPDAPVNFSCKNEDGEYYFAVVDAAGRVSSFSGPLKLRPAK